MVSKSFERDIAERAETEQEADEAKEVLDKANFAQRQQRGNFRLLLPPHLCTIWCLPAKGKETNAPPRSASPF